MQNRLVVRVRNEGVACLGEEIVAERDLLVAGIIVGTGFAPLRGGPINHCLQEGAESTVAEIAGYESRIGERFHTAAGWSLLNQ